MGPVDLVVTPRVRDLAPGFPVRRALPVIHRRMVGPFTFLDQMGPTVLAAGRGLDVPPHPHIGLATITYLFEGEILHRDSLGTVQPIRPGEVNWMTAGRGIVHSERTPQDARASASRVSGLQAWVALPTKDEECAPSFAHHDALPVTEGDGVELRLIAGAMAGLRSPVITASELFYVDLSIAAAASFCLGAEHEERAGYVVNGAVEVDGTSYGEGQLLVFHEGTAVTMSSPGGARVMLLGGARLDGPRHIFWNFVSSSRERIEQAKEDWRGDRLGRVPGETERVELPEEPRGVVRYP